MGFSIAVSLKVECDYCHKTSVFVRPEALAVFVAAQEAGWLMISELSGATICICPDCKPKPVKKEVEA